MGEKENNNNQNGSPVTRWLRNAVLGATMADQPAMMTASGWRQNEKGDYVQDQQNDPHVKQLRNNLANIGETAMTAPTVVGDITGVYNIIRHPRQAINTIKDTLKDATYFIKNPRAKKIYHGSSNNFNLNEARMGSEGNFGLHVTPDKAMAEEFVHNGGSLMEGYVTRKPDAVIPDIGSNDYRFLSNDFKVPEIHRVDGNMGEYYYSLDKGRDNKLFDILNKYGAKPNRYTTRRGQPVIETYKETTIPLRDEVFPTMSSEAIKKSEDLLSNSANMSRTQLNEKTANILSEDGKKLLEYHNVAEGNGGKSYIITDPNIIYTPKTNLDDITSYIGLGKYLPWGFIQSNKKGSKILIKKKNRGKFV